MRALGREAKMHHIAVFNDIVLSFEPELAGITGSGFATEADIIVIGNRFGADEALLEIGVDDARRLRGARAPRHGPRPGFLWARREVSQKMQEVVAGADHAIEPRLGKPDSL